MPEEIKNSLKNNLLEKLSSPFYGTFIVSWLLWNWEAWYATFFIDSDLLLQSKNILKSDYIFNLYQQDLLSYGKLVVFPAISSYLIVFWLPKITSKFYEKSIDTDNKNKIAKAEKDEEYLKVMGKKLAAETAVVKKESQLKNIVEKFQTQEETWKKEYQEFEKTPSFYKFRQIIEVVYKHEGYVHDGMGRRADAGTLAAVDTRGLISYVAGNRNVISLTEKGKFFAKLYLDQNTLGDL